jgi:hypothetical protein
LEDKFYTVLTILCIKTLSSGFHWDRDYGLEGHSGVNIYPHLATVTYLTDSGGPTIILNRAGSLYSDDDHSGGVGEMIISKPTLGKHVKFDGRLLHAAPSNLIQQQDLIDNKNNENKETSKIKVNHSNDCSSILKKKKWNPRI